MISKGQTETNRYRFLARNGGFVWIVTQATVVFDKQKPQSVVCVNYVIRWVHPTLLFPGLFVYSFRVKLSLQRSRRFFFVLISLLLCEIKHVRDASFITRNAHGSLMVWKAISSTFVNNFFKMKNLTRLFNQHCSRKRAYWLFSNKRFLSWEKGNFPA